jgi:hypothetical protein
LQIALDRYSQLTPAITNLSTDLEQLPRRLPPTPATQSLSSTRQRSLRTSGSLSISSRHSPSPSSADVSSSARRGSYVEERGGKSSFEGRLPGEFPEQEDDLVFEMSGINEGWEGES